MHTYLLNWNGKVAHGKKKKRERSRACLVWAKRTAALRSMIHVKLTDSKEKKRVGAEWWYNKERLESSCREAFFSLPLLKVREYVLILLVVVDQRVYHSSSTGPNNEHLLDIDLPCRYSVSVLQQVSWWELRDMSMDHYRAVVYVMITVQLGWL